MEIAAVLLAIIYLVLAVRQHIACWYAAFISTAIYLFIFAGVGLYMQSALQVYYLGMAIYGWHSWCKGVATSELAISSWRWQQHAFALGAIILLTLLSTWLLDSWSEAQMPLLDSFTTWGAVVTTYMVARKILENWLYWLVIDAVSIYLYVQSALWLTAALFGLYLLIVCWGWVAWRREFKKQIPA